MNLGATLKNMVHDEIASRIAAAKRSNGVSRTNVRDGVCGTNIDDIPPPEWSPTIGQPEAANSDVPGYVMQINPGDVPPVDTPYVVRTVPDNYTTLRTILDAAFNHAATGKGKERHARDLPFDEQPMLETTRLVGPGFPLGQAIKKSQEAAGMIERSEMDAAEAECLGAINYLAGAVAWMRERKVREAA